MHTIVVRKRHDDYHACVADEPGMWGCGPTANEAIGDLIVSWAKEFGVTVDESALHADPPETEGFDRLATLLKTHRVFERVDSSLQLRHTSRTLPPKIRVRLGEPRIMVYDHCDQLAIPFVATGEDGWFLEKEAVFVEGALA